jgi:biotin transporter BioY
MYIIAIAWLYVVTLMAATEKTVAAGLLTFIFYGLLPCALLLWILGVKHRRFKKSPEKTESELIEQSVSKPNSTNTQTEE